MTDAARFPPVAELVPHESPMLLVDELLEWSEETALVRATIRAGSPFVHQGRMPASILLEHMAQAIGVANGMADRIAGREPSEIGLLLGTRELELHCDSLAVGEVVELRVLREYSDGTLARYACTSERAGRLLARATINVMLMSTEEMRT